MKPWLLIDTDPGVDDALAILMAHRHGRIAGLSIAAGNVGLDRTVANALKLCDVLGADIPVFAGCPLPLVRSAADAAHVHGADGFGDTGYLPSRRIAASEHAALAMLRISREHAGEVTIVALAPLTNLALALRFDPTLPQRVPRLVVMGGAVSGRGNTTLAAEFNVGFDPEAAAIVFGAWPRLELVDWELTVRHALDLARCEAWLATDDPRARFYAAISRKVRSFSRARGRTGLLAADALAMAVALEPGLVTAGEERHVAVELDGTLTRGSTIVDWERRGSASANARIVMAVDQARFEALVASALGAIA